MHAEDLLQIEEIKKLKARYFRFVDTKRWDELADVFTPDAVLTIGPNPEDVWKGRQKIIDRIRGELDDTMSIHHGHMPEIELTSDTTATGTWAMSDYLQGPRFTLHGYGHYQEEYVKQDGAWRISNSLLTRLHVETGPGIQ